MHVIIVSANSICLIDVDRLMNIGRMWQTEEVMQSHSNNGTRCICL